MNAATDSLGSADDAVGGGGLIDVQRERLHSLRLLDVAERLASFGRIRDPASIQLRIQSARALTYIAATRANVLKDFSLTELEQRLKQLEEAVKKENED